MVLRTSTSLHYAVDNGYSPETTLGCSDTILGAGMGTHPVPTHPLLTLQWGNLHLSRGRHSHSRLKSWGAGREGAGSSSPLRLLSPACRGVGPCYNLCRHKRNGAMFCLGRSGWTFLCCLSPWPLSRLLLNSLSARFTVSRPQHFCCRFVVLFIVFFSSSVSYSFQFLKSFLCLLNI